MLREMKECFLETVHLNGVPRNEEEFLGRAGWKEGREPHEEETVQAKPRVLRVKGVFLGKI